jgi:hypothetical protein
MNVRISLTFICQEKAPNEALFRLHTCVNETGFIDTDVSPTKKEEEPDVSYMYTVYM